MKGAVAIFIVLFALSVESANHKKHKTAMKASDASDTSEDSQWPQPEVIRNFEVPPEFTAGPSADEDDDTSTTPLNGKHHGKSHRKSHSN